MIRRQSHIFYLIIIAYNIAIVHCEAWDDNDSDAVYELSLPLLPRQFMQMTSDFGSGETSKIYLFNRKNTN